MADETVNTNLGTDAGAAAVGDTGTGNTGGTPPSIIGDSRSALQPGDPGYEPPQPIKGDLSAAADKYQAQPDPAPAQQSSVADHEVDALSEATMPTDINGATHVLVANDHVSVLRRLWDDVERGVDGAPDRFKAAFHRVF